MDHDSVTGTVAETSERSYRWVILAILWLLYATFGLVSRSVAPLVTPILRDLAISYGQMGFILGAWQLTYILVAMIAGTIIDRWGVHRSLVAGAVVIGLSATLRHFPTGFGTMLGVVALFGAGAPMISIGGPKAISLWFKGRSRGTAVGLYMTGSWTGGIIALTLTNSLVMPLMGQSWRLTFVCYGLVTFAVALLWWFLGKDTQPTGKAEEIGPYEILRRLIRARTVKIVLAVGIFSFATIHGFTSWLPKIIETSGRSPASAGLLSSIPLIAGIPGVLLIPRYVPPHLRGRTVAGFALITIGAMFTSVTTSGALMLAGLVVFGLACCSFPAMMILILMDAPEVGSRYLGTAGGMFFCVAEIGGFTGPLVMGILVDLTGGFLAGAVFLGVLNLLIFAITLLLRTEASSAPQ